MRISDWSSDVCSSDLGRADRHATQVGGGERECSPDSGQWQGGLTTWPGTCVLGRSPMTISAFRLGGAHFPQTPRRLSNRARWPPTRVAAAIADGGSASTPDGPPRTIATDRKTDGLGKSVAEGVVLGRWR